MWDLPISRKSKKVRKSCITNCTFVTSLAVDFKCKMISTLCSCFKWQIPFHMTWGKVEGESHLQIIFLIYFSFSSSAILSLLAPARGCKQRRKKSNRNACAFQHICQMSLSAGSTRTPYKKEAWRRRKLCLDRACVKWTRLKKQRHFHCASCWERSYETLEIMDTCRSKSI